MADDVGKLITSEARNAETSEAHAAPARSDVTVTRGHGRARTLQIRLNEDEHAQLELLARAKNLPVSTVARSILLDAMAPAGDLRASFQRIERELDGVRRQLGA